MVTFDGLELVWFVIVSFSDQTIFTNHTPTAYHVLKTDEWIYFHVKITLPKVESVEDENLIAISLTSCT